MRKYKKDNLVPQLEKAQRRFDVWRAKRKVGGARRIPPRLWRLATSLAVKHGVDRTRRALGLNHSDLRERTERTPTARRAAAPAFMEFPGNLIPSSGSVVEVESEAGKMRIQLANGEQLDVVELARGFWAAQ